MHKTMWGIAAIAGVAAIGVMAAPVHIPGIITAGSSVAFAFAFGLIGFLTLMLNSEIEKQNASIRHCNEDLARQDELIFRLEEKVRRLSRALEEQGTPVDLSSHASADADIGHVKRATAD